MGRDGSTWRHATAADVGRQAFASLTLGSRVKISVMAAPVVCVARERESAATQIPGKSGTAQIWNVSGWPPGPDAALRLHRRGHDGFLLGTIRLMRRTSQQGQCVNDFSLPFH